MNKMIKYSCFVFVLTIISGELLSAAAPSSSKSMSATDRQELLLIYHAAKNAQRYLNHPTLGAQARESYAALLLLIDDKQKKLNETPVK